MHTPQICVGTALVQQDVMLALLNDPPLLENNDPISVPHGAEAMGNHKCGAIGRDLHQGALDRCFCFVVDGSGGLVED